MLHEYHSIIAMQEHHRRVREVTERAHLHRALPKSATCRRRWVRARRRGPDVASPPATAPAYGLRPSPQ